MRIFASGESGPRRGMHASPGNLLAGDAGPRLQIVLDLTLAVRDAEAEDQVRAGGLEAERGPSHAGAELRAVVRGLERELARPREDHLEDASRVSDPGPPPASLLDDTIRVQVQARARRHRPAARDLVPHQQDAARVPEEPALVARRSRQALVAVVPGRQAEAVRPRLEAHVAGP